MKFTSESKIFLGIVAATVMIILGAVIFFSQPTPTQPVLSRQDLVANAPKRGNPDAEVYLVEFSDFQCPACAAFQPVVNEVTTKYQDRLLFAYRHFPLDQHPYAARAAIAAEAAAQQGKFWEMAELLFANQDKLSDSTIAEFAKQLDLRLEAFNQDLASSAIKQKVEDDRNYGLKIGIDSTPTFFLNGKKLDLRSFADLKKAVEEAVQ